MGNVKKLPGQPKSNILQKQLYLLLIITQMIITADEIYGRMQHSAFDFAAKKPITHTHTDDDNKQRDFKTKNLKASKLVHERKL